MDLVFTHMSGNSYCRWFTSLLSCLCPVIHEEFMLPLTQSRSQGVDPLWKCAHLIEPGVTKISMFVHHNQMEMLCVVSWSCSTVCFSSLFGRERLVFHWQSLCLWVWPDCVTVIDRFSVSGSLVWLCDCVINRFSVFVSLAWLCDCVIDRYSVCESGLIVWLCYWRFSESVSLAWLCDCYWQIQCVCEFGLIVWLAVYMTLAWVCHWQIQHVCEIGLIM